MDGLALALEQAAAYMRRQRLGLADYLGLWRRADRAVRAWHDPRVMGYPRPLAATWQTSIDLLPGPARALLDLIAWLGPEPLPRLLFDRAAAPAGLAPLFAERTPPGDLLARLLDGADPAASADPREALAALGDLSLLQPVGECAFATVGRLHRVLALITREQQPADRQAECLGAALDLLDAAAVGDLSGRTALARLGAAGAPGTGHRRGGLRAGASRGRQGP